MSLLAYLSTLSRTQFGGDDDDDVETTGLRLGGLHFGASPSPDKSGRASPITPIPAPSKGRASFPPTRDNSASSNSGVAHGGGGSNAAAAAANHGTVPSSIGPHWVRKTAAAAAAAAAAGGRGVGGGDDCGSAGSDVGAPPTRKTAGAAKVLGERLAAERVFDSMDQNSGRVSTRRLGELLTMLGTPRRRKGGATDSARAAGLLSMPSFSRQDFVNW